MSSKINNIKEKLIWLYSFSGNFSKLYLHLANCNIFITTRCNSQCSICTCWKMKTIDIKLKAIENIIRSKCISKMTDIGLEGGEFLLHPKLDDIMYLIKGMRVSIISNGILSEQLIDFVKKYNIYKISISLDGDEPYQNKYRADGSYEKVLKTLNYLSNFKDKKIISIIFTPSPHNTMKDYWHVKGIAEKYNFNFGLGMYLKHNIFEQGLLPEDIIYDKKDYNIIPDCCDFGKLLHPWLNGNVVLPCLSKEIRVAIWPGGELPFCFATGKIIGNLNEMTIDEIFSLKSTKTVLQKYKTCNKCWLAFHRSIDVELMMHLKKIIPQSVLRLFWKNYKVNI